MGEELLELLALLRIEALRELAAAIEAGEPEDRDRCKAAAKREREVERDLIELHVEILLGLDPVSGPAPGLGTPFSSRTQVALAGRRSVILDPATFPQPFAPAGTHPMRRGGVHASPPGGRSSAATTILHGTFLVGQEPCHSAEPGLVLSPAGGTAPPRRLRTQPACDRAPRDRTPTSSWRAPPRRRPEPGRGPRRGDAARRALQRADGSAAARDRRRRIRRRGARRADRRSRPRRPLGSGRRRAKGR